MTYVAGNPSGQPDLFNMIILKISIFSGISDTILYIPRKEI